MTIKVYDLCGAEDRRFSPFCWRIRLALAHKGLNAEFEPMCFTQKDKIAFADSKTVPVLVDGETVMNESWDIADYLEKTYQKDRRYLAVTRAVRLPTTSMHGRIRLYIPHLSCASYRIYTTASIEWTTRTFENHARNVSV